MNVVQNLLGSLFIISGLFTIFDQRPATGVLMTLLGTFILPAVFKWIEKQIRTHFTKGGKFVLRLSLFFLVSYSTGKDVSRKQLEVAAPLLGAVDYGFVAKRIKAEKDIASKHQAHLDQAAEAIAIKDVIAFEQHIKAAMELEGVEKIPLRYFEDCLLKSRGNPAARIKTNTLLLSVYPEDPRALLDLANTYFIQKEFKQARLYYTKYLKLRPEDATAITSVGICERELGNKDKAKKYFKEAMKIEGKGGDACRLLGELSYKIVGYNVYSLCCDGSVSDSVGSGACSHHKGVCKTVKEGVKESTIKCL